MLLIRRWLQPLLHHHHQCPVLSVSQHPLFTTIVPPSDKDQAYYRRSPSAFEPAQSQGQRRLTAILERALVNALHQEAPLKEQLLERHGFSVHHAWLSSDRRQLNICWDCFPPQGEQCGRELERLKPKIQRAIADRLSVKKVPLLCFTRDKLTNSQARAASALEHVEAEVADAQQQHGSKPGSTVSVAIEAPGSAPQGVGHRDGLYERAGQAVEAIQQNWQKRRTPPAELEMEAAEAQVEREGVSQVASEGRSA